MQISGRFFTSISPLRDTLDDLTCSYYTLSPKGPITLGYTQAFATWCVKRIYDLHHMPDMVMCACKP